VIQAGGMDFVKGVLGLAEEKARPVQSRSDDEEWDREEERAAAAAVKSKKDRRADAAAAALEKIITDAETHDIMISVHYEGEEHPIEYGRFYFSGEDGNGYPIYAQIDKGKFRFRHQVPNSGEYRYRPHAWYLIDNKDAAQWREALIDVIPESDGSIPGGESGNTQETSDKVTIQRVRKQ